MKALIAVIALTVLSQASFATSPYPVAAWANGEVEVSIQSEDQPNNAEIRIMGKAAELLYKSLDVQAQGSFGLVQTQTKTTEFVQCVQAIMGDTPAPGEKLKARYSCTLFVPTK